MFFDSSLFYIFSYILMHNNELFLVLIFVMLIGEKYQELIKLCPTMAAVAVTDIRVFAERYGNQIHPDDLVTVFDLCYRRLSAEFRTLNRIKTLVSSIHIPTD